MSFDSKLTPSTFGTFFIQVDVHLKPFAIVVLNGEITVYSFNNNNNNKDL